MLIIGCLGFGMILFSGVFIIPGYNGVLDGFVIWARVLKVFTAFFLAILLYGRPKFPLSFFIIGLVIQGALWLLYFLIPGATEGLFLMFQILSGFTFVIFLLLFIQFLASYPPHISRFTILSSALLSHLVAFVPLTLPTVDKPLLQAILMGLSLVLLGICIHYQIGNPQPDQLNHEGIASSIKVFSRSDLPHLRDMFKDFSRIELIKRVLLLGAGVIVLPFIYGVFLQISFSMGINMALGDQISELSVIVVLLILLVVITFIDKVFSLEKLFAVVLPLFATVLLLTPLFWDSTPVSSSVFIRCGFIVYSTALWIFLARITFKHSERRLSYFSLAIGLMWMSVLLGQSSGSALTELFGLSFGLITGISLLAVWILLVGCVLLLYLFIRGHDLLVEKTSSQQSLTLIEKIGSFSEANGLSPREAEILIEFAHGRSASHIGSRFFISEHTVKTHLRRIYSKAGVHNRQDLLDLIERVG